MTTNKEKFLALVTEENKDTARRNDARVANADLLAVSQYVAFYVLEKLDELGWTQKDLAEKLAVRPQEIETLVKGQQLISLEMLVKLAAVLDVEILIKRPPQNDFTHSFLHFTKNITATPV